MRLCARAAPLRVARENGRWLWPCLDRLPGVLCVLLPDVLGRAAGIPTGVTVFALGRLRLTQFPVYRAWRTVDGRDAAQSCGHARRCYVPDEHPTSEG